MRGQVSFGSMMLGLMVCAFPGCLPAGRDNDLGDMINTIYKQYGIAIILDNSDKCKRFCEEREISGDPPTESTIEASLKAVVEALRRYPVTVLDRAKVCKVVLMQNISWRNERRKGLSDIKYGVIYLDTSEVSTLPWQVHHEVFHMLDFHDDREIESDTDWQELNAESCSYQGNDLRMTATAGDDAFPAGFISRYSISSVKEDKAEVFAALMTDCDGIIKATTHDSILSTKVEFIRKIIREAYPELSTQVSECESGSKRKLEIR